MRHRIQHWEQQTLLWFQERLRRAWLTAAMKTATFLGNGGILWLTACACLLFRQQTRRASLTALLSLVFCIGLQCFLEKSGGACQTV